MSTNSNIEWTTNTWNPIWGCTKISPGCKHCYAETLAERFRGKSFKNGKPNPFVTGFDLRLVPHKLAEPLHLRTPGFIFVNSMSDLFQERVPSEFIEAVCEVMMLADWHTFQVLTKRSERMLELLNGPLKRFAMAPHIWWGVSVEDKEYGLSRIEHLRAASVAVRFLSVEPLLEDIGEVNLSGIHWVIVGGESGRGARPMSPEWATALRDQCVRESVPYFFKQWGGANKKKAGRLLDGKKWEQMPTVVRASVPDRDALKRRQKLGKAIAESASKLKLVELKVPADHEQIASDHPFGGQS